MSGTAATIVGALIGGLVGIVAVLAFRVSTLRERVGKLEEWVRVRERELNHKGER